MYRIATRDDIEECVDLFFHSTLNEIYKRSTIVIERDLSNGLKTDSIIVYEDDSKKIGGYIRFKEEGCFGHFPYLDTIIVHEKYKGKGVGRGLLNAMEETILRKRWESTIFLCVASINYIAEKFYQKDGYIVLGEVGNLLKLGVNEKIMYKNISRKEEKRDEG